MVSMLTQATTNYVGHTWRNFSHPTAFPSEFGIPITNSLPFLIEKDMFDGETKTFVVKKNGKETSPQNKKG